MMSDTADNILAYVKDHASRSSKEIYDGLNGTIGYATVKRVLNKLRSDNLVSTEGKGKGTKYVISAAYELLYSIDLNQYF